MLSRYLSPISKVLGLLALAALAVNGDAEPALDKAKTDQSGVPLPPGAIARMGTGRWRHGATVSYVAYTPDGKAVLTAGRDNTIRLWDRATGKEIRRFDAKAAAQQPLMIPGAMGGFSSFGAEGSQVALSQDGKVVAAIVANSIRLWDVDSGKEIRQFTGPKAGANVVVFAPDGKSLALRGSDRVTTVVETATGKEIRQIKAKPAPLDAAQVVLVNGQFPTFDGLAFSPDGKLIATAETEVNMQKTSKYIKITNLENGNEIRQIAAENGIASIAYSPDGKILAFGSGTKIHLCAADTGKEIRRLDNKNVVVTITFAHDGKTLAARASDMVVRLFETSTGKNIQEMGMPVRPAAAFDNFVVFSAFSGSPETRDLAFAPGDQTIAAGGAQSVRFWNAATGKEHAADGGHRSGVSNVLLTPDGKTMISHGDDRAIRRWDAITGQELGQFDEPRGTTNVVFAPDGKTLALANTDGTIRLLAPDGKELHKIKGHANGLASLAFTPNSKTLASRGTADNIIRLHDVAKGQELKQINVPVEKQPPDDDFIIIGGGPGARGGQGFVFSPDGQILAAYVGNPQGQGPARLATWDVATGKELRPIPLPTQAVVYNLVYSPDGRLLAAQNADQTVSLWEIASGKERAVLGERQMVQRGGGGLMLVVPGNTFGNGPVAHTPLGFSPDGTLLASGGPGNAVRVWQVSHAQEIGVFKGHDGPVNAVSFAAVGNAIASASADTTLLVWDLTGLKREPKTATVELEAKQIETLWADLAGTDAFKAGKSIQTLASAPKQGPRFLREKLKPAVPVDGKKLAQWIADLDSSNFTTRNVATGELEKLGDQALPALRKLLASQPTVETRRRVEPLIEKAITGVLSPDQVRLARAIEVLERVGNAESRQILEALAHGAPGALQSRQAQAVLDRLAK